MSKIEVNKRVYFTLDCRPPCRLYGQFKGRSESVYVSLVLAVLDNKKTLLFEEELALAERCLRHLICF